MILHGDSIKGDHMIISMADDAPLCATAPHDDKQMYLQLN